jgi:hypothetical protein
MASRDKARGVQRYAHHRLTPAVLTPKLHAVPEQITRAKYEAGSVCKKSKIEQDGSVRIPYHLRDG